MDLRITVVGGTGFIGRRLVERLVGRGASVRIISRHAADKGGPAPQIERVVGSIEDPSALERAVDGASAVVNLVGTTAAKSERQFYSLHRDAPGRLAAAARHAGVRRFIHVSAMGIGLDAPGRTLSGRLSLTPTLSARRWCTGRAITFSRYSPGSSAARPPSP
jgi:uncharacterized protein YbjT (DUF2867 family)